MRILRPPKGGSTGPHPALDLYFLYDMIKRTSNVPNTTSHSNELEGNVLDFTAGCPGLGVRAEQICPLMDQRQPWKSERSRY